MILKNPFGLRNGQLVNIHEIKESGLGCNCFCPNKSCNSRLIARKGKLKTHHFAHESEDCNYGLETALHLMGKKIIQEQKKIIIPNYFFSLNLSKEIKQIERKLNFRPVSRTEMKINKTLFIEQEVEFKEVYLEKKYNDFIPDLILKFKKKELIVEIVVTHDIDEEKYKKIKTANVSAIRIYLGNCSRTLSYEKIKEILLKNLEKIIEI
mgnify:CR=1 FL=1